QPISQSSRRRFLASVGITTTALWLTSRRLFAAEESPVTIMRAAAATAKITVTKLRVNLSVLEGSGGNIAVLKGRAGDVLADAGITGSRRGMTEALGGVSWEPVKH